MDNGGSFELIAGLDFKTTDSKSLQYFINLKKEYPKVNFYCFGDRKEDKTNIVFHPKIYLFEKGKETTGIVGSANMTRGGFMTNFEVNTVFKETKPLYFSQLQAIMTRRVFTHSTEIVIWAVKGKEWTFNYEKIKEINPNRQKDGSQKNKCVICGNYL